MKYMSAGHAARLRVLLHFLQTHGAYVVVLSRLISVLAPDALT